MINAKVVAHSTHKGKEVISFELEYPRYIHAELMTHRVFSRNAASSRAIPITKVIEQVKQNTVMPMWTQNQSGMQGSTITNGEHINKLNTIWVDAAKSAIAHAKELIELDAHKQNVNRLLEPFQHIKVIITTSDLSNWFALRNHPDAQPEIRALAREMLCEYTNSTPYELAPGQWHLPYVGFIDHGSYVDYVDGQGNIISLDEAKKLSASCCAQVSYRLNDTSLEKAQDIFDRLIGSVPIHASPFEHQCRPLRDGEKQCGNLIGFTQYRKYIEESLI